LLAAFSSFGQISWLHDMERDEKATPNFSAERVAAGGTLLLIRSSDGRRHHRTWRSGISRSRKSP
jgi:hypothetical protein